MDLWLPTRFEYEIVRAQMLCSRSMIGWVCEFVRVYSKAA